MTRPCPRCRRECAVHPVTGEAMCSSSGMDLDEWVRLHRNGAPCWWCERGGANATLTDRDGTRQRVHGQCGREAISVREAYDMVLDAGNAAA